MERHQVRVSEGAAISDFIDELVKKAWQILSMSPEDLALPPRKDEIYSAFERAVTNSFRPVLNSYGFCGAASICSEELESTNLSLDAHSLDASPLDSIYHLMLETDVRDFVVQLAEHALVPLKPYVRNGSEPKIIALLTLAFREVLSVYLYDCPYCGKLELCMHSHAHPTRVWKD